MRRIDDKEQRARNAAAQAFKQQRSTSRKREDFFVRLFAFYFLAMLVLSVVACLGYWG